MKKRVVIVTMIFSVMILLTACGGGSGNGGGSKTPSSAAYKTIPLSLGNPTKIDPGYEVTDASDDALIDIEVKGTQKTVTLVAGSASLKIPNL